MAKPISTLARETSSDRKTRTLERRIGELEDILARSQENLHRVRTELQETRAELLQANKMGLVGTLAVGAAHQVNSRLGIVFSRLECLLLEAEEHELDRDVLKDLEVLRRHTEQAADVTRRLLTFSRLSGYGKKPLDINHVVYAALNLIQEEHARRGIRTDARPGQGPLHIMGNANQLEQALMTLFTNAWDAMPHHGRLQVETGSVPGDPGRVFISIMDNGVGILQEHISRIFDPFFTTKPIGKGTGLGLSVCYGIVKEHAGSITVDSEVGRGATFTMEFPRLKPEDVRENAHVEQGESSDHR